MIEEQEITEGEGSADRSSLYGGPPSDQEWPGQALAYYDGYITERDTWDWPSFPRSTVLEVAFPSYISGEPAATVTVGVLAEERTEDGLTVKVRFLGSSLSSIRSLAGSTFNRRGYRLHLCRSDVCGFAEDKLIHISEFRAWPPGTYHGESLTTHGKKALKELLEEADLGGQPRAKDTDHPVSAVPESISESAVGAHLEELKARYQGQAKAVKPGPSILRRQASFAEPLGSVYSKAKARPVNRAPCWPTRVPGFLL